MDDGFWIPKPKRWDFMTLAILIPVIFSAIGLVLMAIESYVFAQFSSMNNELRITVSLISSICMAIGGELGSISNCFEVFSKYIKTKSERCYEWEKVNGWDWSALIVSFITTLLSFFIASSTRTNVNTAWQNIFSEWLVLPLILLSVADIYSGMIEGGMRLGSFDTRMIEWIVMRKQNEDEIKYLAALETSNKFTKIMPTQTETQNTLHCWCGKELKNERAYNAHLRIHKNEVRQQVDASAALKYLQTTYHYKNSDFDFPTLSDIIEWRT